MAALEKVKDVLTPKKETEKDRVGLVKQEIERLTKARQRWEYKWREAEEFDSGRHFVVFDRHSGKFTPMKARPGMAFRVSHISWKKKRELQNTILMNDPRWKILPSPEAVDKAQTPEELDKVMSDSSRIKQWFDEIYKDAKVKVKLADAVEKALVLPYSGIWVDYDEQEAKFCFEVCDAFDLLFEGSLSEAQELPSITKMFKRDINQLKANPRYAYTESLQPDSRQAGSDQKNDRSKEKYSGGEGKEANTIICYETWQKVYLSDDTRKKIIDFDIKAGNYKKEKIPQPPIPVMDEMGLPVYEEDGATPVMMERPPLDSRHWTEELPDGHAVMYKTMTTKGCDYFHLEEYIDFPIYPVGMYKPETGPFFKVSWLERMMSANKSLDMLKSRAEEYASMAGGRIMKQENTTISRVETEMGSAMEYDGPVAPTWESAPDLPATLMQSISMLESEIASYSVVGGNVAEVAHNGRGQGAMESIKSSDMASVKTPVDLLATLLEDLAVIIQTLTDYYMDKPQTVRRMDGVTNRPDYFSVIGKRYTETEAYQKYAASKTPPIPVDTSIQVQVEIEPGIAMTPQAKLDLLFQALNLGVVDAQTILEQMKFENIADILARVDKRQQLMSMIETPDFQALDPEVQLSALDNAMGKNLTMARNPESMPNIGTVKKISQGGRGNG